MEIKSILVWLLIFVVGSLIVSFLIYPQSFESFKSNIGSVGNSIKSNIAENSIKASSVEDAPSSNIIKLIPSEMEEYGGLLTDLYKSCAYVEMMGESAGIYDMKSKVCREACGKRDMEYYSNDCPKDILICYCEGE